MGAQMITTVQQLRDLDPEKVPAYMTKTGLIVETWRRGMFSDEALDWHLPATPLAPMQDTHEPTADDGYVSRNVYDYDEPEPPADVREALYAVVIDAPATGRPLVTRKYHPDDHGDQVSAYMLVDRILAAGFRRTPTQHVVTTGEELRHLDGEAIRAACGWVLTVEVGEDTVVLAHGSDTLDWTLWDEDELFPATILTPAPAPIDREALALRICHARRGHVTPGTYGCGLCRGEVDRVLDAIEGVRRG